MPNSIDKEAVQDLFMQLLDGAVLDGKSFTDCDNPWEHCCSIVRSWYANRRTVR